ncbi:hypothetical protein [uncultured Sneathiella sp.]|uniref:hypothetical protein n=1 Tax=uncultured Sneathiella sp. TaxID=879315 RepID=UPI002599F911|nr:hypothetical protein [uncultured Sneathiella sp.]
MTNDLKPLLDAARKVQMSSEEIEQQRVSFAYGNTKIENDRITIETVRKEAELLKAEAVHA